ncbi:MAG TPA: hypothetical protein VNK24_07615 [Elusimicrobiota bacterium]|nr:hypothetical protein [Elusimicrobiota bacterium]
MTAGGIVLSLKIRGYDFPYFLSHYASRVSFAQLGPNGRPDMDHLFSSNYHSGRYVYALNLPQGRYVPVAASYDFLGARDAVVFNPESVKSWTTEVKPGRLSFMGQNLIWFEWENGVELSTRTLMHLPGLIPFVKKPLILMESRLPARDVGAPVEAAAFRRAAADLSRTLWLPEAEQELEETGNPPPPLWKDFFHRHLETPIDAGTFSYYDLLPGWRGPVPIAGGLEWNKKHGKAAVAVSYVSPEDPAYKPVPDYLEAMRGAGIATDDHVVSKINFSTWTAYSVLYTSYDYPSASLVGSGAKIYRTRTILIPAGKGYYLIHYRALRKNFDKYYGLFSRFAWYLTLAPPKPKPPAPSGP